MRRPRNRWAVCSAWTLGSSRVDRVIDGPALLEVGGIAHGGQQRPDHFVPRPILGEALIDPGLIPVSSVALAGRADLKQVAQLDPPELDEFVGLSSR